MLFEDVTRDRAQEQARADEDDQNVVEIADHRNEIGQQVDRRGDVEHQRQRNDPRRDRDSVVADQGAAQRDLVEKGQLRDPPGELLLIGTLNPPQEEDGEGDEKNQAGGDDGKRDPNELLHRHILPRLLYALRGRLLKIREHLLGVLVRREYRVQHLLNPAV